MCSALYFRYASAIYSLINEMLRKTFTYGIYLVMDTKDTKSYCDVHDIGRQEIFVVLLMGIDPILLQN